MKILFDQGTPVPLRLHLSGHIVETAYEKGWNQLKNGELLLAAEGDGFDVMITTDQNLQYQQNLDNRQIALLVLNTTSWPVIRRSADLITAALEKAGSERYQEIDF